MCRNPDTESGGSNFDTEMTGPTHWHTQKLVVSHTLEMSWQQQLDDRPRCDPQQRIRHFAYKSGIKIVVLFVRKSSSSSSLGFGARLVDDRTIDLTLKRFEASQLKQRTHS